MGENSGIEWTTHSFNPWVGCTKVSAGCTNCYAEDFDRRVGGVPISQRKEGQMALRWGLSAPRTRTTESYWRQPLAWNAAALAKGQRARVFAASLADVFEENPNFPLDAWRLELFEHSPDASARLVAPHEAPAARALSAWSAPPPEVPRSRVGPSRLVVGAPTSILATSP